MSWMGKHVAVSQRDTFKIVTLLTLSSHLMPNVCLSTCSWCPLELVLFLVVLTMSSHKLLVLTVTIASLVQTLFLPRWASHFLYAAVFCCRQQPAWLHVISVLQQPGHPRLLGPNDKKCSGENREWECGFSLWERREADCATFTHTYI